MDAQHPALVLFAPALVGHQIPAWFAPDGQIFVAMAAADAGLAALPGDAAPVALDVVEDGQVGQGAVRPEPARVALEARAVPRRVGTGTVTTTTTTMMTIATMTTTMTMATKRWSRRAEWKRTAPE